MSKIEKFANKTAATVDEFAQKLADSTGLPKSVILDQVVTAVQDILGNVQVEAAREAEVTEAA